MADEIRIRTREMHTGGEPVRIVESGYPEVRGDTILDKRRYAKDELDHLRRMLMHEPRGHYDMYGVIPVAPDHPDAAMAVLFMHNEGYSTMCGHATIALGRYALDEGIVSAVEPETRFVLQCPCGPVTVRADVEDGQVGDVRFESVGAFALAIDQTVDIDDRPVRFDVGYGGAFYAIASAAELGLELGVSPTSDVVRAATALTRAVPSAVSLGHPDDPALGFLYGSIITDGREDGGPSTNVCVFADAQVDRSPTGSGVTARMALRHARGTVTIDQPCEFVSLTGSVMTGTVVADTSVGDHPAVTVEVSGRSYYTGTAEFVVEADDPLRDGFLLR